MLFKAAIVSSACCDLISTDVRQAYANAACALGFFEVVPAIKLDSCAHARPVWIGPESDIVLDGSTSPPICDGVLDGFISRSRERVEVIICAVVTANNGGNAVRNFMLKGPHRFQATEIRIRTRCGSEAARYDLKV